MISQPALAGKISTSSTEAREKDLLKIIFPILATPKFDGIRAIKVNGKIVTKNFKKLPNNYVREILETPGFLPDNVDGELMLVDGEFNDIQSAFMSFDGEPKFVYRIFDYVKTDLLVPYRQRMIDLEEMFMSLQLSSAIGPNLTRLIEIVKPIEINNLDELKFYEDKFIEEGYEGIMTRNPEGRYKCGRGSLSQKPKKGAGVEDVQVLIKIKKFEDSEAVIVNFVEKMHNDNAQTKDAFGYSKRSSKKEGMRPAGTLGALIVREVKSNGETMEFELGSGINHELGQKIWDDRENYIGKIVSYRFQPVGILNKPRFPTFKCFRDISDMSADWVMPDLDTKENKKDNELF